MSRLQTHGQTRARSFLRIAGIGTAGLGLLFLAVGMISFFSALGGDGPPRFFWCGFVGMPLLFAGSVMCMFGFLGSVSRYVAAEQVPVVTDAAADLAEGTQGAVKTVARAMGEGFREGMSGEPRRPGGTPETAP